MAFEFIDATKRYGDAQNPLRSIDEGCPECGAPLVEMSITFLEDAIFRLLPQDVETFARSLNRVECQDQACRRSWSLLKAQPLVEVH